MPSDEESAASSDSDFDDEAFDELEDESCDDLIYYPICCRNPPGSNKTNGDDDAVAAKFTSLEDALRYDKERCNFDLLAALPSASDDEFYESAIVCINMCRKFVMEQQQHLGDDGGKEEHDKNVGAKLHKFLAGTFKYHRDNDDDGDGGNEQYYKPVLMDDAFLMTLDDLEDLKKNQEGMAATDEVAASDNGDSDANNKDDNVKELQSEIALLQQQLDRAKELIATLTLEDDGSGGKLNTAGDSVEKQDNDTYYFSSYSTHYIHETMLKDTVRTAAYENAILQNSEQLFKDKIVLDIGCGTGVLSIFAAKAGARKVIAVDGSSIIHDARNIIDLNGYGDKIICCQGMLEKLLENNELPLEADEKVDVIVSEWMGYALFFETMLPSVMKARDAAMASSGTMYPNAAQIFLEGASDPRLDYWSDVHGIDMTPIKTRVAKELVQDAGVEVVDADNIVTDRFKLKGYDLNTCQDDELDFSVPFALQPKAANNDSSPTRIDKLVVSFDIDFNAPGTNAVSFSTGCQTTPTHWKQTVLWFDPVVGIPTLAKGDVLRGQFKMGRNAKNHREMDFDVSWEAGFLKDGKGGKFVCKTSGRIETKLGA